MWTLTYKRAIIGFPIKETLQLLDLRWPQRTSTSRTVSLWRKLKVSAPTMYCTISIYYPSISADYFRRGTPLEGQTRPLKLIESGHQQFKMHSVEVSIKSSCNQMKNTIFLIQEKVARIDPKLEEGLSCNVINCSQPNTALYRLMLSFHKSSIIQSEQILATSQTLTGSFSAAQLGPMVAQHKHTLFKHTDNERINTHKSHIHIQVTRRLEHANIVF